MNRLSVFVESTERSTKITCCLIDKREIAYVEGLLEKLRLDCDIDEVGGPFYAVDITNVSGSIHKEMRTRAETLAIIEAEEIGQNARDVFEQTVTGGKYSHGDLTISVCPDNGCR